MIIDGRKISLEIKEKLIDKVTSFSTPPMLGIVSVGKNSASQSYMKIKERFGSDIGVVVEKYEFSENISTEELVDRVRTIAKDDLIKGLIVQLPLPANIDREKVLSEIPFEKDPDALNEGNNVFQAPVALAVKEIFDKNNVDVSNKNILVVGQGKLVGSPVIKWLQSIGVQPAVADIDTKDLTSLTQKADIIISGAGSPGLINADMVKEGVVLIDAGTSESNGKIAGDVSLECAEKAEIITPVPGGLGPIVVAKLFENLLKR